MTLHKCHYTILNQRLFHREIGRKIIWWSMSSDESNELSKHLPGPVVEEIALLWSCHEPRHLLSGRPATSPPVVVVSAQRVQSWQPAPLLLSVRSAQRGSPLRGSGHLQSGAEPEKYLSIPHYNPYPNCTWSCSWRRVDLECSGMCSGHNEPARPSLT